MMNPERYEAAKREIVIAFSWLAFIAVVVISFFSVWFGVWRAGLAHTAGPRDDAIAAFSNACAESFRAGVYEDPCMKMLILWAGKVTEP